MDAGNRLERPLRGGGAGGGAFAGAPRCTPAGRKPEGSVFKFAEAPLRPGGARDHQMDALLAEVQLGSLDVLLPVGIQDFQVVQMLPQLT